MSSDSFDTPENKIFKLKHLNMLLAFVVFVLGVVALYFLLVGPQHKSHKVRKTIEAEKQAQIDDREQILGPVGSTKDVVDLDVIDAQKTFDDWSFSCVKDILNVSRCTITQTSTKNDKNNPEVFAKITMISSNGKYIPRISLYAPLGVFLPEGLSVDLKGQDIMVVPYISCDQDGCYINLDMSDSVVDKLMLKNPLSVSYVKLDSSVDTRAISLRGFERAYRELVSYVLR